MQFFTNFSPKCKTQYESTQPAGDTCTYEEMQTESKRLFESNCFNKFA